MAGLRLRRLVGTAALVLVLGGSIAQAQQAPRPAHPAVRYSCMSDPPPGTGWPWVAAGVPSAIEVLHPGYEIDPYAGFVVPGLRLFLIVGAPRATTVPERYAYVEAADERDGFVGARALFVRSLEGVTDPYAMALRAMAILMRRADERPLREAGPEISEPARSRVVAPAVTDHTLTFWVRVRSDMPYAWEVSVDLDTGVVSGDPG